MAQAVCTPPELTVVAEIRTTGVPVVVDAEPRLSCARPPAWTLQRCNSAGACIDVTLRVSTTNPWRAWFSPSGAGLYVVTATSSSSNGPIVIGKASFRR